MTRRIGLRAIKITEYIVLVIIAAASVVAIIQEIMLVFRVGKVAVGDLLLLFIYLEVLAMVSSFIESGKVPVRMPLYIAIVALARYLILDMKNMDNWRIAAIAGAGMILALTVIIIRWGHIKLPYANKSDIEE